MFGFEDIAIDQENLQQIGGGIRGILPEILLAAFLVIILLFDVISKGKYPEVGRFIGLIGLISVAASTVIELIILEPNMTARFFNNSIIFNSDIVFLKILFHLSALLTFLFPVFRKNNSETESMEYYAVLYTVLIGLCFLVMSNNIMIAYLSIEIISIGSYILIALRLKKQSTEASVKYLLFGAFASGIMLYGLSMMYGIKVVPGGMAADSPYYIIGVVMFLAGLLFKSSSAPFHVWAPDVYQGGFTPLIAFLSTAPKIAAIFFMGVFAESLGANLMGENVYLLIGAVAVVTMFVGNAGALNQDNLKRMLAYSSIAHSGFLLVIIVCCFQPSVNFSDYGAVFIFYSVVYMFANYVMFYFAYSNENNIGENISDYKGVGKSMALVSILLIISLVSLIGIPPAGGFWGKFFVFSFLYEAAEGSEFLYWIFVLGIFNTVIALFYYLKLPYFMYLKTGKNNINTTHISVTDKIFLTLMSIPVLVLFFKADWLVQVINAF